MASVAVPRGRPGRLAILTDETLDENLRQLQPDSDAPSDTRSVRRHSRTQALAQLSGPASDCCWLAFVDLPALVTRSVT